MAGKNEQLNWRVFNHLLATHGAFPPDSITTSFVSSALRISESEANSALSWAVDQDLMLPVYNEHKPETLYRFVDLGIKNGMIIELDNEVMDRIGSQKIPGCFTLQRPGFEVKLAKNANASCVLSDHRVMIKGVGYFPQAFFRERKIDEKQLYLVRNEHGQPVPAYWKNGQWVMYNVPGDKPLAVSFVIGKVVPCEMPDESLKESF